MKTITSIISVVFVLVLGIVTSILFTIGIGIILGIEPFQDASIVLTYGDRYFASWVIVALAFMCFWAGAFMSTKISSYMSIFLDLAIYFCTVSIASLLIISYRLDLSKAIKDLSYWTSISVLVFAVVALVIHCVKIVDVKKQQ
ncbi:MAG: hypothetical protein WCO66_01025 [Candidatus Absconditabacteria bacterium]